MKEHWIGVPGAANVGLMGMIADAVLSRAARRQGVIAEHLMAREVGYKGLTKPHVVRCAATSATRLDLSLENY